MLKLDDQFYRESGMQSGLDVTLGFDIEAFTLRRRGWGKLIDIVSLKLSHNKLQARSGFLPVTKRKFIITTL